MPRHHTRDGHRGYSRTKPHSKSSSRSRKRHRKHRSRRHRDQYQLSSHSHSRSASPNYSPNYCPSPNQHVQIIPAFSNQQFVAQNGVAQQMPIPIPIPSPNHHTYQQNPPLQLQIQPQNQTIKKESKCFKCCTKIFPHQPLYMLACFINIGAILCSISSFLSWLQADVSCSTSDSNSESESDTTDTENLNVSVFPHYINIVLYACGGQLIATITFGIIIWKLGSTPYHKRLSKIITLLSLLYGVLIYFYIIHFATINDLMTNYTQSRYIEQYGLCQSTSSTTTNSTGTDTGTEPYYKAETTFWRQSHSAGVYLQITAIIVCLLRHMCCSSTTKYC